MTSEPEGRRSQQVSSPIPASTVHADIVAWVALGLLLALGLTPLCYLVSQVFSGIQGTANSAPFLESRTLRLLARSVGIAATATLIAVGAGGVCGLTLARIRIPGRWPVAAAMFGSFCISPYVLALGWLGGDLATGLSEGMLGRPLVVAWVLGAAHVPLAALVVLFGARQLPTGPEEAALLAAGPGMALPRILARSLAPTIGVAALLVFDLCLADYAVASLLQVPTYPVEVFLYYAGMFQPAQAARACMPMLGLGLVLAVGLSLLLPRAFVHRRPANPARDWALTRQGRILAAATLAVVLAVTLAPPLVKLAASLPSAAAARRALTSGMESIGNSLGLSLVAAVVALVLAWPASGRLAGWPRGAMVPLAAALLLPVCVPPSAYGIAWVELMARFGSLADRLGFLGPALCLAARLGGPAALFLAAARLALPAEPFDAALIQEGGPLRRHLAVVAPGIAPAALAAAGVLSALALNAVGLLVLTVPPGFEILSLRTDNLLHYGLPGEAIVLALATAALACVPAMIALGAGWAIRRRSRAC